MLEVAPIHARLGYARTGSLDNSGWIEFESPTPLTFDVLRLEEAIEHGQHIANHRVDVWEDGGWRTVHWGTTIGNARLAQFAPCTASRIRVVVEFAYDTPRLRGVALFGKSQAS